jgi:hypothetical protein
MINLDDRYHSYLYGDKRMTIDGVKERVKGYGWRDDGTDIIGHYVITENYKLNYNMNEQFISIQPLKELVSVA